jgi:hypothetical protein
MKYFIALCFLAVGFMMALKPDWIMNVTGRIDWVERHLFNTYGGTRIFYQLLGAIFIFLSIVIAFGRLRLGFLEQYFSGLGQ